MHHSPAWPQLTDLRNESRVASIPLALKLHRYSGYVLGTVVMGRTSSLTSLLAHRHRHLLYSRPRHSVRPACGCAPHISLMVHRLTEHRLRLWPHHVLSQELARSILSLLHRLRLQRRLPPRIRHLTGPGAPFRHLHYTARQSHILRSGGSPERWHHLLDRRIRRVVLPRAHREGGAPPPRVRDAVSCVPHPVEAIGGDRSVNLIPCGVVRVQRVVLLPRLPKSSRGAFDMCVFVL